MIDLHIHTTHSDGIKSVTEILKAAEELNLVAISITDHDVVDAYVELENNPNIRKFYSGKIIPAVEINCHHNGVLIHILGYGIDYIKIQKQMPIVPLNPTTADYVRHSLEKTLKGFGINAKLQGTLNEIGTNLKQVIKENENIFPIKLDVSKNKDMWWEYSNPESIFHVDFKGLYLSAEQAIDVIRLCGGLAVIAHPFVYGKHKDMVLNSLINKVDGIECYHNSADQDQCNFLIELCKKHGLIITGGSDWHGGSKYPLGSENVPDELLEQFPTKIPLA